MNWWYRLMFQLWMSPGLFFADGNGNQETTANPQQEMILWLIQVLFWISHLQEILHMKCGNIKHQSTPLCTAFVNISGCQTAPRFHPICGVIGCSTDFYQAFKTKEHLGTQLSVESESSKTAESMSFIHQTPPFEQKMVNDMFSQIQRLLLFQLSSHQWTPPWPNSSNRPGISDKTFGKQRGSIPDFGHVSGESEVLNIGETPSKFGGSLFSDKATWFSSILEPHCENEHLLVKIRNSCGVLILNLQFFWVWK